MSRLRKAVLGGGTLILVSLGGGAFWIRKETSPMPTGEAKYVHFGASRSLSDVLKDLQGQGVIKNASALQLYALFRGASSRVGAGSYLVKPGMSASAILKSLRGPVHGLVRIPEQNWILRTANLLEKHQILPAQAYVDETLKKTEYEKKVAFPIEGDSLEGYLFGDTYDLAPAMAASEVVERQLKAFERKVWNPLGKPAELHRALIVASMIELEVAKDSERPMVAGVIENRIKKGMPLQIDATVCYAKQKWGPLAIKELTSVKSPYNTYLNKGLPPGPICSPSIKSIEAALNPASHEFLYYVAMPEGYHVFSKTMPEHEHNIRIRKQRIAALKAKAAI